MYDALGYFEILGADLYTNPETLKLLYHEKAKFWHPDVNQRPDALENFQKLSKAYDMLKNEQFKTAYVLLSMIYKKNDFPSFERLKVYLDAKGFETPFLRVFHIQKIIRKKVETSRLVGTFEDALDFLKKTTFENIKNGLFCRLFIPTLKHNLGAINTDVSDNFKLLIHNAATFYLQGKLQNAYLSALQAKDYASSEQKAVTKCLFIGFASQRLCLFGTKGRFRCFYKKIAAFGCKTSKMGFQKITRCPTCAFYAYGSDFRRSFERGCYIAICSNFIFAGK